jgi:hypothetical protein
MNIKFIILSLFILSSENCILKNPTHSQFWEHFFNNQNSLQTKYSEGDLYPILFGGLKPEQESLLYKKTISESNKTLDEVLFLSASVKREKESIVPEIHNRDVIQTNEEYFTMVEYSKSKFKEKDTYQIKRSTFFRYPKYTFKDFINWMEAFALAVHSEEKLSILNKSILYQFLCSEFRCTTDNEEKTILLSFALDKRMVNNYKSFYNRIFDILTKLKFKVRLNYKQTKIAEIFSEGKIISARIFPIKKAELQNLNSLELVFDIDINFYGLRILIQNIEYSLQYNNSEFEETLKGSFQNTPKYKVSGRVFYFLPTSLVNFFIPGDIESYIADSIQLLTKPNEQIGGNFVSKIKIKDKVVEIRFDSYSEVFQKSFKPLSTSSNLKREGGDFFQDMRMKIIEDLL